MDPSLKYMSPSATRRSNAKDGSLDYSLHHNNNNNNNNDNNSLFLANTDTNGLLSKGRELANNKSTNSLQVSPQLSPSSSLSSQSTAHPCDTALVDTCATQAATNTNLTNNQSSSPTANSSYNSSFGSNSGKKLITESVVVPGGVVTTQNISTVIRPRSNNNSLQFVKIKTPESSIKAVEQVRIAEENKISKDKIREVEEEWQNNLLNWKSKRRQQFSISIEEQDSTNNMFGASEDNTCGGGRKIKTFAEMLEERAKSGNRLGFHLQRYIGADEDEEEEELRYSGRHQQSQNGHDLVSKHDTQNKQVSDSDDCIGEVHSSTSSGNSELGEKSLPRVDPTPPPRTTITTANTKYSNQLLRNKPNTPKETVSECDKSHLVSSKLENRDETDNLHSISLVARPLEADQLSSTLRPTDNNNSSHLSITSRLNEVNAKINQFRATNGDSDDSVYEEDEEEDEEEHEEQKQLQRIAFVAKLKAFERLTQQTSAQTSNQSLVKPKPSPKPTLNTSSKKLDHKSKITPSVVTQTTDIQMRHSVHPQEPQPPVEKVEEFMTVEAQVANSIETRQLPKQMQPSPLPLQLEQDPVEQSPPPPPPVPVQRPLPNRSNSTLITPTQHMVTLDNDTTVKAQASIDSPPQSPAKEQRLNSSSTQSSFAQNHLPPSSNKLPTPPSSSQAQSIQRSDSSFKNQVPSSRRAPKDDKDRTVLSVSGKKRCSSCKEELGRGAAAFVVESLGLVYHTNCFRCSVCHVNLSNGFRGVDVRVHAGALHCQNCYSKDGLNYSRV